MTIVSNEGGVLSRNHKTGVVVFFPMVRLFPASAKGGQHPDPELLSLTLTLTTRGLLAAVGVPAIRSLCLERLCLLLLGRVGHI